MLLRFRALPARRRRMVIALVAAAVGSTTCGQGPSAHDTITAGPPATSTAPSTSALRSALPPTSSAAGGQGTVTTAVLAAYTGMWAAMAQAAQAPGAPHHLAEHTAGIALRTLARQLLVHQQLGRHTTGRPTHRPQVQVLIPPAAPIKARVQDCLDTTAWVTRGPDGRPVVGDGGGRRHVDALVKATGGRWRVTEFVLNGIGTC
jgi:hypothetical protein